MILVITDEPETAAAACLARGPGPADRAADRLGHGLDLDDVLLDHGVGRKRLDRVVLDAVAAAAFGELKQLDGGGTDVQADQRWLGISEKTHGFSPCHGRLHAIRAPLH